MAINKIGIAADHGGFQLKEKIKEELSNLSWEITDYGAGKYNLQDDYPDIIVPIAKALSLGKIDRGIAICGSGVGASIVANKIKGVKAALITETYSAHQGVEHDHMNMLCIGGRVVGSALALEIVKAFLNAVESKEERHLRRIEKLEDLENRN